MKIRLISDIHMEGYAYTYKFIGEDLIVLAGDIHTNNRHHMLLDQMPTNIPILMVPGNHEYYYSDFDSVNIYLKNLESIYTNFHCLLNESITIDGVNFYGGTMFTDFKLYNDAWLARRRATSGVSDFTLITKTTDGIQKTWTGADHEDEHIKFVNGLTKFLTSTPPDNRVVISHFMPTDKISNPIFDGSQLQPYFIANMEKFFDWTGLWLCGHGHSSADIMVDGVRVVINPRGYGRENEYGFNNELLIEI